MWRSFEESNVRKRRIVDWLGGEATQHENSFGRQFAAEAEDKDSAKFCAEFNK